MTAEAIITTRGETPYAGFADFLSRVPNTVCQKRTVESLIKAGAFDGLGLPRQAMTAVHEDAVEASATAEGEPPSADATARAMADAELKIAQRYEEKKRTGEVSKLEDGEVVPEVGA